MKILYLLQSPRFSGAENVVCQIIGMLKNESNIELVYCSPDGQIREALNERKIEFEPLERFSIKEVSRAIKKHRPDIIHAHDRNACVLAAITSGKTPIISHIHVNNNSGILSIIKNIVFSFFIKKYRHIFWVSDSAYEQFPFKNLVRSKSSVLYNVIDIKALYEKADSDIDLYNYDIVFAGRLSYQKDPERLMKVLHGVSDNIADVKIAIVGSGEYKQYVIDYINNNQLESNIHYLGYLNNPLKIIKSSKALILTSRFEGTPMVSLEAQCFGVPVVSTPVDGMKKVITNGYNGYLSNNDDEIVRCLTEIVSNESTRMRLSKNSLKYADGYNDVNKYCTTIIEAYNCE